MRVEQLVVGRAVEHLQVIHQLLATTAVFQTQGMDHARRDVSVAQQLCNQAGPALVRFQQLGVLLLLLYFLDDLAGQGVAVGGALLGPFGDLLHGSGVRLALYLLLDDGRLGQGSRFGMVVGHHVDAVVELLAAGGRTDRPLGAGIPVLLDK